MARSAALARALYLVVVAAKGSNDGTAQQVTSHCEDRHPVASAQYSRIIIILVQQERVW